MWMIEHPAETQGDDFLSHAHDCDPSLPALRLPTPNRWTFGQLAFALTLGSIDGLRRDFFDRSDVLQGAEFETERPTQTTGVACHYYSQNTRAFGEWVGLPVGPPRR
jgi:hypothetical protein